MAFRYALNRGMLAAHVFLDELQSKLPLLSERDRAQMKAEIKQTLNSGTMKSAEDELRWYRLMEKL